MERNKLKLTKGYPRILVEFAFEFLRPSFVSIVDSISHYEVFCWKDMKRTRLRVQKYEISCRPLGRRTLGNREMRRPNGTQPELIGAAVFGLCHVPVNLVWIWLGLLSSRTFAFAYDHVARYPHPQDWVRWRIGTVIFKSTLTRDLYPIHRFQKRFYIIKPPWGWWRDQTSRHHIPDSSSSRSSAERKTRAVYRE